VDLLGVSLACCTQSKAGKRRGTSTASLLHTLPGGRAWREAWSLNLLSIHTLLWGKLYTHLPHTASAHARRAALRRSAAKRGALKNTGGAHIAEGREEENDYYQRMAPCCTVTWKELVGWLTGRCAGRVEAAGGRLHF